MNQKPKRKSNQTGVHLLFGLGAILALTLAMTPVLFRGSTQSLAGAQGPDKNPMVLDAIGKLSSSQSPGERIQAARWLASQYAISPESVVRSLGESLAKDPDPAVRAQAAVALGNIARQLRASDSTLDRKQEKVIAEYLNTQYFMEVRDSVRRTIVGAASELNCPEVESLIESATGDTDPSVKEEALRARLERHRRSQLDKLG